MASRQSTLTLGDISANPEGDPLVGRQLRRVTDVAAIRAYATAAAMALALVAVWALLVQLAA